MTDFVPSILALDFDGVICDGLIEYFQTAWQAYRRLWHLSDPNPPEGLAEQFYALRPVVETGWEMPILIRSLLLGSTEADILNHWQAIAAQQLAADGMEPAQLAAQVDGVRDAWIAENIHDWLAQHRFYPGVLDRVQQALNTPTQVYIITTKEGRFVRQLLQQQGVKIDAGQILGKEVKQPKYQILQTLQQKIQATFDTPITTWFVEDRLKTLQQVQAQPELVDRVTLFLADWGYNTAQDRATARQSDRIYELSLSTFSESFANWL